MKLQINLPFSMSNYKICAVYQITFDDGSFYIGGSTDLRKRASSWNSTMEVGKGIDRIGESVMNKIRKLKSAALDIIELCNEKDLRDRESFYLDKYRDDEKMVSSNDYGAWKAILQYKKDGVFIKKHYSISAAARYNNVTLSGIQRVLNGERVTCNNMVFIYEHDYHDRRKQIVNRRYEKVERKKGRLIVMINEKGEAIKQFRHIIDAAKEIGCNPTGVSRVLSGFQQTAGGYIFRYA